MSIPDADVLAKVINPVLVTIFKSTSQFLFDPQHNLLLTAIF